MVRSATDGHDAHVTYCNFASGNSSEDNCNFTYCDITHSNCSKDNCNIDYYNSAYCDFTHSNIASFGGCFCVPRRLV